MTNIKFGECLSLLLSSLDISMNQLAKSINVDNSLVSRWVNGKRIPGYNTKYIEDITDFLLRNIKNSYQKENLIKFLKSLNLNIELENNIYNSIKTALLESQGYSLSFKKKDSENKSSKSGGEKHLNLNINNLSNIVDQDYTRKIVNLSKKDKILFGSDSIINEFINLLNRTIKNNSIINKTIYISYTSSNIPYCPHKISIIKELLLKQIEAGWEIILLLKLDNNMERTVEFINLSFSFLFKKNFKLFYFYEYGKYSLNKETLIISDLGALSCLPGDGNFESCYSFYIKNKVGVDILRSFFDNTILNNSKILLKKPFDSLYFNSLDPSSLHLGNNLYYGESIPMYFLPLNLFKKLLIQEDIKNELKNSLINEHQEYTKSFLSNILIYEYKYIFSTYYLQDLIENQSISLYSSNYIGRFKVSYLEIILILENIIKIIKNYNNFHIGFNIKQEIPYSFTIKENNYICLKDSNSQMFEYIDEPTFIKAFEYYFLTIWNDISHVYKDKEYVVGIIKRYIEISYKKQN